MMSNDVAVGSISPGAQVLDVQADGVDRGFWEDVLETSVEQSIREAQDRQLLREWIGTLSPRQRAILCRQLGINTEKPHEQREALEGCNGQLLPFCLVDRFGKGKSEVAVVEVARERVSPHVVDMCIRRKRGRGSPADGDEPQDERYDKTALLFALYQKDQDLLKEAFHFDKVHKKGFASMVLAEAAKSPPKMTFLEFLTPEAVAGVLESYQRNCRDGSVSELQAIWMREGRPYVFIRRTERPDHIHDGRHIVHGYRAEWIVLDFSSDGDQVNIASTSVDEPREIADRIASAHFGCPCRFVNEERATDAGTIELFLTAARAAQNGVGLVEVCVSNSPLRGSSKVRISNEQVKALVESLDHLDATVGTMMENLADVDWIKVLYRRKRVGLQFDQDESGDGQYVVRYTDQRLNAFERRRFEQQIRDDHGITILSTEKR